MSRNCNHRNCREVCHRKYKPKEQYKIRPRSVKRQKIDKAYRVLVAEMAKENNLCEIRSPVCQHYMNGADHQQKRSPANLIDPDNLKRACNACNLYKEQHPQWATANGHSISRFKKKE